MLKASVNGPELFERVRMALECGGVPTTEQHKDMHEMVALMASLPHRVKTLKDLVDALAQGDRNRARGLRAQHCRGR